MRYRLLVCALVACGGPEYHLMGPVVHDIPAPPRPAQRTVGPMSPTAQVPPTDPPDRQAASLRAERTYLDRAAIHDDTTAYLRLVDELFPHAATPERTTGLEIVHREMATLERLAPYSLGNVALGFLQASERLPVCVRPPGQMWPCFGNAAMPATTGPAFEVSEAAPGVATFTIRDLSSTADWSDARVAFERLARAKAIVVDMRTASGADPRPLVPWLERVTGRAPLTPLRAIVRPPDLDPYVADYLDRYIADTRARDVWNPLVGTMPPARDAKSVPIAVVVGAGCGAACELAARVLVAYAGATLFGGVQRAGRLERDEPARFVLPHSKVEVYFDATEYLLDDAIEAATGPTAEWYLRVGDIAPHGRDDELVTFAAHELAQRLAGVVQPRCDALPAYTRAEQFPPALKAKLNVGMLGAGCRPRIELRATAPLSAVQRFAATCSPAMKVGWSYIVMTVPNNVAVAQLSQLAQSDLVERIDVDCEPEYHID